MDNGIHHLFFRAERVADLNLIVHSQKPLKNTVPTILEMNSQRVPHVSLSIIFANHLVVPVIFLLSVSMEWFFAIKFSINCH